MSIPSMVLLEGTRDTEGDIFKKIALDYESRKYIHVSVNNVIKTYDNETKEETVTVNKYPMELCSLDIMKSEYEIMFIKHIWTIHLITAHKIRIYTYKVRKRIHYINKTMLF